MESTPLLQANFKIWLYPVIALALMTGTAKPQKLPPVPVDVAPVKEFALKNTIQLTGTALPWTTSQLAAEVEGRVNKLFFEEGQFVKKGKLLVQMRTEPLELELALTLAERNRVANMLKELKAGTRKEELSAAKAALQRTKARLQLSITELERLKELYEDGVVSLNEYDRARAKEAEYRALFDEKKANYEEAVAGPRIEEIKRAEANLQAAEDRIRLMEDKINRASIRAPFSGHIVKKETEVGQWLDEGESALTLIKADPAKIEIALPQFYFKDIQEGNLAEATLDFQKNIVIKLKGKVIEKLMSGDLASRTFPVRIRIENKDYYLAPGMLVKVKLYLKEKEEKSLFVPKDAVVRSPKGAVIWVVRKVGKSMKALMIPVRTEQTEKNFIAIKPLKGTISKHDRVVIHGNERLRPNSAISIQKRFNE
tara:strand:- start:121 stop:1398 length:1278 start_codon:yes stop_codon:yes gene_type:complete